MAASFDTTLKSLGITRSTASAAVKSTGKTADQMTSGDFIKLMTAQLQNQDPFNPTDNSQMVAQMAQFSSLSVNTEMNSTLKAISTKLGATSSSDALSYVGKTVLTEGSTAYPRSSGGLAGAVELDAGASDVSVQVRSADGALLKTLSLGKQAAGTATFDWDGTTDSGAAAGDGPFTVIAQATNAGAAVTSRTLVWAPVQSVSMPASGGPVLTLPGIGRVAATAVRQIS